MPVESLTAKQARARKIVGLLRKTYPNAQCSLNFSTPHQLLVATILSAQCTDERVNLVTPQLFKKYPGMQAFADAPIAELEEAVKSTGFFRNKAKAIKESAQQIIKQFGGELPRTLVQLTALAGAGRKTASVVLGVAFNIAEGVVVDTHVGRISRLLGLTRQTSPEKVEQDLMKILEREDWIQYSHLMIYHGRAICKARKPDCPHCVLNRLCPSSTV